jgi:CheY-like chemotaxis protein
MGCSVILCVDDYETSLGGWCLYLQSEGYLVTTAQTAQEGLQLFAVSPIDLVLLDYALPDSNGDDVAAIMKRIKPDVRILMLSGVPNFQKMLAFMLMHLCKKASRLRWSCRRFATCSTHPAKRPDRARRGCLAARLSGCSLMNVRILPFQLSYFLAKASLLVNDVEIIGTE